MQLEYRFSLTPRLVAVGLFSLLAIFVLLFLLGMQVGQRARPLGAEAAIAAPLENAVNKVERQAADAETAVKTKLAAPAAVLPTAAKP
jgi:hypothetical protein